MLTSCSAIERFIAIANASFSSSSWKHFKQVLDVHVTEFMQWWNTSSDNNTRIHSLESKFNFWRVFFFALFFLPVLVNSITCYIMCFAQTIPLKLKWCKLYQKKSLLLNSRLVKNRWITCLSSIDRLIAITIASLSSSSRKHFNQCSGLLPSPLRTLA